MKDIPGYEGLYSITEDGKVWSYPKTWISGLGRPCSHNGKWISQHNHTGGYLQVVLTKERQSRMRYVHRLVAQTYIPNPNNLPEVNHKDANKKNNHYSNLEWASRKFNALHAKQFNLYGPKNPARGERHADAKLTNSEVVEIRQLYDFGWPVLVLLQCYPIAKTTMYSLIRRKNWAHIP